MARLILFLNSAFDQTAQCDIRVTLDFMQISLTDYLAFKTKFGDKDTNVKMSLLSKTENEHATICVVEME